MSGAFSAVGNVLKSAGQAVGFVPQDRQKIKLPSGKQFAGLVTPGLSLLGNDKRQFELSRTGFDVAAAESGLGTGLRSNLAGVQGLRSQLAPLRGGVASLQTQFPGLRATSAALGGRVRDLLAETEPGFGRLTRSLVEGVRNREAASVGNLRSALAKRNVLGSSFADRELQRTSLDFAEEEERVRSAAFAQELAESRGLIQQAAELIKRDAGLIQEEAANLGLQLGLTEAEAGIFGQEMANLQQQQSLLGQIADRQLQELNITGNITNQVQSIVAKIGAENAEFAAGASMQQQANLLSTVKFAGLGLALCWVAREVYGREDPRWLMFRDWMLTLAPAWLRRLYIRHGSWFAAWLHRHPRFKPAIRKWMDGRIVKLGPVSIGTGA